MCRNIGFLSVLILLASPVLACQISLAYNSEPSSPYFIGDGYVPPKKPGAAVELLQLAATQIGCTLKLTRLPNMRVLAEAQVGKYDGVFMYSYNAERAASFVYPTRAGKPDGSRRITSLSYYLYRAKGASANWDGQHFSGINGAIGVNLGWSVGKDLLAKGLQIEEAISTRQNFAKLRNGRIAAYATQDLAGDSVIQEDDIKDVERLPTPISSKDYFILFNPTYYQQNHDRVEQLWNVIGNLRESSLPGILRLYEGD
ncbi:substrate-binding periplasmic protein [Chitinimonas sp. PSY-7]|uniref:substrate-binding periplasmic protein n=1 Tax=Chitinimonas sp. PSY-7 TaxID=3459088 RepID=UPI00403FF8E4